MTPPWSGRSGGTRPAVRSGVETSHTLEAGAHIRAAPRRTTEMEPVAASPATMPECRQRRTGLPVSAWHSWPWSGSCSWGGAITREDRWLNDFEPGSYRVNFPGADRVPLHLCMEVIMTLPFAPPVHVRVSRQTWLLCRVPSARLPRLASREIAGLQGSLPQFASSK